MACALAAVDVQGLAGDEGGSFEIEDSLDDVVNLTDTSKGVKGRQGVVRTRVLLRVLMTPRETALARTPREAYSMASDRVTASSPPLVSTASAEGRVLSA